MLPVIQFQTHSECRACSLSENRKHVGLATRAWDGPNNGKEIAVLVIGKAPGWLEERDGKVMVEEPGSNGAFTQRLYVEAMKLHEYADVYLTNTVRCAKLTEGAIPPKSLRECRKHLEGDVAMLAAHYREVVVLLTGPDAIKSVYRVPKTKVGNFPQGRVFEFGGVQVRGFATFLPAELKPGRDPSKRNPVEAHLQLLVDYLRDGKMHYEIDEIEVDYTTRIDPEDVVDYAVSLDTETYGSIEGLPEQRFFHPKKCFKFDGVTPKDLVITASFAWRSKKSGLLCNRHYVLSDPKHRQEFLEDLRRLAFFRVRMTLVFMNAQFDLVNLRASDLEDILELLKPYTHFWIEDVAVWNFLHCDVRTERGLKTISPLLGVTSYEDEEISLKRGERYPNRWDKRYHQYQTKDSLATIRNREVLRQRIAEKFGAQSNKLSEDTRQYWSDLLWFGVRLSEAGLQFNVPKLRKRLKALRILTAKKANQAQTKFGATFAGKGVKKYLNALVTRCVTDLKLSTDKRLERSKETKAICANKENLNLFIEEAEIGTPLADELHLLLDYRKWSKTQSLVESLLGDWGKRKPKKSDLNNQLVDGRAYPTVYVVPTESTSDFADDTGGTQQGRITFKGPALQTFPPKVETCAMSRFKSRGGRRFTRDSAQIELRVPAMYSGEPTLIEAFANNINLHAQTASFMVGFEVNKAVHKTEYHLGKTGNFAIQFRAGAKKVQVTARKQLKLEIPLARVKTMLENLLAKRKVLVAWQDNLIETACIQKYLELLLFGISRTFEGSEASIKETYIPTIVNVLVQTLAAILIITAQIEVDKELVRRGSESVTDMNTYDEGGWDCLPEDEAWLIEMTERLFKEPPIYERLIALGLTRVPLASEVCFPNEPKKLKKGS